MGHGPSTDWGEDKASGYKTRLGLWMFLAYCVVYAAFVVVSSFWPKQTEEPIGPLNGAVAWGFGLIVLALIMAVIYNALCNRAEKQLNGGPGEE